MSKAKSTHRTKRTLFTISLALAAAGLLLSSLRLSLWHMRMEAPQYQDEEALRVNVFAGSMTGDLREIAVLNQYIGVHLPEVLPHTQWLPLSLSAAAALGILASLMPRAVRRVGILVVCGALTCVVSVAVIQAKQQMYDIGHKRDAHTKMARVQDFNPPFLGTAKIAQFTVSSRLGVGAYLIGAAILMQAGAAFVTGRPGATKREHSKPQQITSVKTSEALA